MKIPDSYPSLEIKEENRIKKSDAEKFINEVHNMYRIVDLLRYAIKLENAYFELKEKVTE